MPNFDLRKPQVGESPDPRTLAKTIKIKQNKMKRKFLIKRIARNVQMDNMDLREYYDVDSCAQKVMASFSKKISPQLYEMLMQQLLGFHHDMQLEMAVNLMDFVNEHLARTTGCPSVDGVLDVCYSWIAIEHNIMKPSFQDMLRNVRV